MTAPNGERFEHHVVRLHQVAMAVVLDEQNHWCPRRVEPQLVEF